MTNIKDIKSNLIADLYKQSVVYKSQKALLKEFSEKEAQLLAKANKIFLALKLLAHYNVEDYLYQVSDKFIKASTNFLQNKNEENKKALLLALQEISSSIDSLYLQEKMSFENLSIFKEVIIEYINLVSLIWEEENSKAKDTLSFSLEDFASAPIKDTKSDPDLYKGHIKDTMSFIHSIKDIKDTQENDKGHIKDIETSKGHKGQESLEKSNSNRQTRSISLETEKQIQSRRLKIIELLKTYGSLTSSEIHKHLPEISKKTLQRELAAMVEEEILNREGEKRWTRYSIKI